MSSLELQGFLLLEQEPSERPSQNTGKVILGFEPILLGISISGLASPNCCTIYSSTAPQGNASPPKFNILMEWSLF